MNDVRIDTPRGITLAGTLQLPAGAAPIDLEVPRRRRMPRARRRDRRAWFCWRTTSSPTAMARTAVWTGSAPANREAGLATLSLDFSGPGRVRRDVITLAARPRTCGPPPAGWQA